MQEHLDSNQPLKLYDHAFLLLDELQSTGLTYDLKGNVRPFVNLFGKEDGLILHEIVRRLQPRRCLEIGFGHGSTTLYILQALKDNLLGALITMDPGEMACDGGTGLMNVKRAGLEQFHSYIEAYSQHGLPELERRNQKFDFIWIDSNHQFDQTMLELYYANKMLNPGGVIGLDDWHLPSVQSAANFYESNLPYKVIQQTSNRMRFLQKTAADNRTWQYFKPFAVPSADQDKLV